MNDFGATVPDHDRGVNFRRALTITDYDIHITSTPWRNLTVLELKGADGLTGLGEARVVGKTEPVRAYLNSVERYFVGKCALDIAELHQEFKETDFGRAGEVAMTALALVEMACWDMKGKALGVPVYDLVGGQMRPDMKIPAYANAWYTDAKEPADFYEAACVVGQRGYRGLKFDPFGAGTLELDAAKFDKAIESIAAVARAAEEHQMEFFVEMHGRFTPMTAIRLTRAMVDRGIRPGWIEEPIPPDSPLVAHKLVADAVRPMGVPIASGERLYTMGEFLPHLEAGVFDIIQPDINQCGGFWEVRLISELALRHKVMVAPHNVGGIVSTAATLHLMAGLRNGKILEHFNDFADCEVKGVGQPYPEVVDGFFSLPTGPGWGVALNHEYFERHPPNVAPNGAVLDPGLTMFKREDWSGRGQGQA